jgi:hypothetical protein
MKTPEDIEAEIWQHALDLAEPGGLGRLVEADAVVQALILAAGRLAEHTAMPLLWLSGRSCASWTTTLPGSGLSISSDSAVCCLLERGRNGSGANRPLGIGIYRHFIRNCG